MSLDGQPVITFFLDFIERNMAYYSDISRQRLAH